MAGVQHFNIYRDNQLISTTNIAEFSEDLAQYGNYTYRVSAQYAEGESTPETDFISWGLPEISVNRNEFDFDITPDDETTYITTVSNSGTLPLEIFQPSCGLSPFFPPLKAVRSSEESPV